MTYGIFKKSVWKCLITLDSLEQAKKLIKNRNDLEIREIIEYDSIRVKKKR